MGGIFGVASKNSCTLDLFFGVDYHSHLGTKRGGMAVYGEQGFARSIHNIENSPFRTKFDGDLNELEGYYGIGCISDNEPQPLLIQSHLGSFAITTVGKINNQDELIQEAFRNGHIHFMEMSHGRINSFESFSFINLGYSDYKELGPGEIVFITPECVETMSPPRQEMKICSFLWVYYGYPTSTYEGVNVESMRYECGKLLAKRDEARPDVVAGVPDSGIAHAIGYANESGIPFARPFIKYTPTWPRSFMPQNQGQRNLIAKMKLIPVDSLIRGKKLLLIDDSIVRGTQLGETSEFLYQSGAKEVHIRPACPPLMFGCPYLNFSRSSSELDLITRRIIKDREGGCVSDELLADYANPDSGNYKEMMEEIRKRLNFTTLRYHRLDDLVESIGISPCKLCTYCWNGKK